MKVTRPLEIEPITRIMYWNEDIEKLWKPRIQRINKVYSKTELETVTRGHRRIYVYHVHSNAFDKSYEFLRENNLEYYPTNKSAVYQGFSHKHRAVKPGDDWMLYGGACRRDDIEAGELFTQASTGKLTDHTVVGDLLGYPISCVEFFNTTWGKISIDPIFEAGLNTPGMEVEDIKNGRKLTAECHPYCNNMLRYFGIRITPHLTHSFQCEDTIEWGKSWMDIMKELDPKAAEWAIEIMSMPLTWNCYKAVAIVDNELFRGVTNSDPTLEYKIVENKGWTKKL